MTVDDGNSQVSQSSLADFSQTQTQLSSSFEYEYMPPSKSQKLGKDPKSTVSDAHIFGTKSIRQLTDVRFNLVYCQTFFIAL